MAHFQQILEGESNVMDSLVAVAVFQIRQGYVEMIECDDTDSSVKSLAKVLLTNFDKRYVPACSDTGKLEYHCEDTTGKKIVTLAFISISLLHHWLTPESPLY
jgi:hypothetical protein